MKKNILHSLFISTALSCVYSCSKNNLKLNTENNLKSTNITNSPTSKFCDCETYAQSLLNKSEVCISGITNVTKGTIYTYTYTIGNKNANIKNAVIWDVLIGEIAIMNVETEIMKNYIISKCTVRIKNNFKYGSLKAKTISKSLSEPVSSENEVQILIKAKQ